MAKAGFTLVELLVVIVILGVLAGIVVFAVGGITNNSTKSACNSDVATAQTAEDAYFAQNNAYVTITGPRHARFGGAPPANRPGPDRVRVHREHRPPAPSPSTPVC